MRSIQTDRDQLQAGGQLAASGVPDGLSCPLQALPNGAPTSSKPSSPALIGTKEPNGSVHTNGSTSEEPEEHDGQVRVGLGARMWPEGRGGRSCHRKSPVLCSFFAETLGRSPPPKAWHHCPLINYMGWGWGRSKEGSLLRPCLGLMSQNPVDMWAVRPSMENSTGSETVLKVRVQA